MSLMEQILTIAIAVLAVQITRWLPFWIFPANRPIPEYYSLFRASVACGDVWHAGGLLL